MHKFLSFDLEIATTIPEGVDDWSTLHPMGITCAATWASDESNPRLWCGHDKLWGHFVPQMVTEQLNSLINYLMVMSASDYKIVTLNGAGFDFRELAASSGRYESCKQLAWNHYDIFYAIFCQLGYAPGLNKVAQGMNCGSKTQDVDGAKAPELWATGQYGKVLEYVANDAKLTLDVAQAVAGAGEVRWISKSGKSQRVNIDRLLTVQESSLLPLPDNSWMDKPWTREKFIGWLSE